MPRAALGGARGGCNSVLPSRATGGAPRSAPGLAARLRSCTSPAAGAWNERTTCVTTERQARTWSAVAQILGHELRRNCGTFDSTAKPGKSDRGTSELILSAAQNQVRYLGRRLCDQPWLVWRGE